MTTTTRQFLNEKGQRQKGHALDNDNILASLRQFVDLLNDNKDKQTAAVIVGETVAKLMHWGKRYNLHQEGGRWVLTFATTEMRGPNGEVTTIATSLPVNPDNSSKPVKRPRRRARRGEIEACMLRRLRRCWRWGCTRRDLADALIAVRGHCPLKDRLNHVSNKLDKFIHVDQIVVKKCRGVYIYRG